MQNSVNKKVYQQNIVTQNLQTKTIRYTFAKKFGKLTGSIGSKAVILVFCPQTNELFYLAKDHKIPIVSQNNLKRLSGKDTAEANRVKLKDPGQSNKLLMSYFKKGDDKGKQSEEQWQFQMANTQIAKRWFLMLKQYKQQKQKKPQASFILEQTSYNRPNNSNQPANNYNQPASTYNLPASTYKQPAPIPYNQPKPIQTPKNNPMMNSQIKSTTSELGVLQNETQLLMRDSKLILKDPSAQQQKNPNNSNMYASNRSVEKNGGNNSLNNSKLNESRIIQAHQQKPIIQPQYSKVKPENENKLNDDWNYRFLKNPTRQTVLQFEQAAFKSYQKIIKQSKQSRQIIFVRQIDGFIIQVADNFTQIGKRLKNQYRNYHYIIQCCRKQYLLNVPLACLIQYLGSICLVKAQFPKEALKIKNKKELQSYLQQLQVKTRISNSILFSNKCSFYDLTKFYGSNVEGSRIYVDDLYQYMTQLSFTKDSNDQTNNFYVRPQLMQYFQNQIISGGNIQEQKNLKIKNQILNALDAQVRDISQCLSSEEIYVMNIFDLKQFFHYRGLNMKFLGRIYNQTRNKFVKKYLLTCLIAKIIKDQINFALTQASRNPSNGEIHVYVQQQIRYFIEGKTATTNQYWKKISLKFREIYGVAFNSHEIVGGFLLSCLINLIPAKYNLECLDKQKVIFRDQGIIKRGFLQNLYPKVKSYYRFSNKIVETVQTCKYSEEDKGVFDRLVQCMNLKSENISPQYDVNKSKLYILGYLSSFIPPQGMGKQSLKCSRQIYSLVNSQPPSAPSLKITLNYFTQFLAMIKNQKPNDDTLKKFEEEIQISLKIINYWLQFQHPKICQFYQKIANYQQITGNIQQSIKVLEKAIDICYKTEAKNSKKLATRHYVTGSQYLKVGRKKQAIENLQKAKSSMQKSEGQQHQHALVLLKLSSLHLNNGDTDTCIKLGKQALKNAQKGKMMDTYTIKICQILCRAYQIKGQKQQLRKLSTMCAKDFNKTQNKSVFNQMVKICLTGIMARLNIQRSRCLFKLASELKKNPGLKDQNSATIQLMEKAKSIIVMENFMSKCDNVQKYFRQYQEKKQLSSDASQYIQILTTVAGCVGIDFIEGLHTQKQFE